MSIALNAVVYPSKKLQKYAILFSFLLILVAVFIAGMPNLSPFCRSVLTLICILASVVNIFKIKTLRRDSWQISIDSKGEIACRKVNVCPDSLKVDPFQPYVPCQLINGTTLWHRALFLRLRRLNDDEMINLVILSDALKSDEFRRLSVACRWIDAHGKIDSEVFF